MKIGIKHLILSGEFNKAKDLLPIVCDDLRDIILQIGFDEESICSYSFITYLINQNETADKHYLASELLTTALCQFSGAYQTALFHTKRAIELNPSDITLKEYLLLFNEIPEKLISDDDAKKIAQEIIKELPDSKVALRLLDN